jgi:hypothetical protein
VALLPCSFSIFGNSLKNRKCSNSRDDKEIAAHNRSPPPPAQRDKPSDKIKVWSTESSVESFRPLKRQTNEEEEEFLE